MKVCVKFFVFDLPPGFNDAQFEFSEGADINSVFDKCLELFTQRQVTMDEKELRTATVLIDGKWSDPESPIYDGAAVTIIRPMDGG